MAPDLQNTIALLTRTPAALNALLRELPESWTLHNEGGDTWSAFDVVGHLIEAERVNWMPRARMLLEHGETRAFEPFARAAFRETNVGKSLAQLLDEFDRARAVSLAELRALDLQPADLERRGLHPTFGPITLRHLLSTWAVHDLTHLHQLARVMAHQYRQEVGPYVAFLGVLKCSGHSGS
jgi:DinB superfamily